MGRGYPGLQQGTHRRTTVSDVPVRTGLDARRLLERPVVGRALTGLLAGRLLAGPRIDDALRVAAELVATGRMVALEHVPGPSDDAASELATLIRRVHVAGLAAGCELTLPVGLLGPAATASLAEAAGDAGVEVVLAGPPETVPALPGAGFMVPAGEPGAENRCRGLAGGRVRLTRGRGAAADLAFVRCLNVLMAGDGRPEIEASDPRLIAIAGERAAWNGRTPDSWEHVMPYGVLIDEQRRLVAGGHTVRVAVPSGAGAVSVLARRLGGRRNAARPGTRPTSAGEAGK
jgi:proline dehydrogenase